MLSLLPGMAGVVPVVLQQDIVQAESEVDGGNLPVREGQIDCSAPEI